jgi:branched-chain amino acid transport system permease protein
LRIWTMPSTSSATRSNYLRGTRGWGVFWQQVVSGLSAGCLYALAALGLVLVYRTMEIVNFAHGEMAMISTFVAYTLLVKAGLPYVLAMLGAWPFAFIFGMAVERVFLRPIQEGPLVSMMIMTLGLFHGLQRSGRVDMGI